MCSSDLHVSQVLKNGLVDLEAIEALARHRGFQGRIRHAEAFATQRFVWSVGTAPAGVSAHRESSPYGVDHNKRPASFAAGAMSSSEVWAADRTRKETVS